MNTENDKQPSFRKKSFCCPLCDVVSQQIWAVSESNNPYTCVDCASCGSCHKYSIWFDKKMIYPKKLTAPLAHAEMPDSVKKLYEEARQISNDSPRSAAALLRVTLEKLTEELGEKKGL